MNYLLIGTETYTLTNRRKQLEKEYASDVMNITVYPFDTDASMEDIISDCQTLPFFADSKIVILENPAFIVKRAGKDQPDEEKDRKKENGDLDLLLGYLDNPNESTALVICVDQEINRRRREITSLSRKMKYETFDPLSAEDFRHYVVQDINDSALKIGDAVLTDLLERLPISLENWKRELEKLKLYPGKITPEVISQLIARPLQDDVFALSDGVVRKNLSKAMRVFSDLMLKNKNDIYSMVGLLAYQFRFMCQCKALYQQGLNQYAIAREMNVNEYRVKMALQSATGLTVEDLLEILNRLACLDQDIKQGKTDPQLGLEMFIIERCRRKGM